MVYVFSEDRAFQNYGVPTADYPREKTQCNDHACPTVFENTRSGAVAANDCNFVPASMPYLSLP